jgi:4-hydroxythreonine-4-phosphate dehydrogenase
MMITNSLLNQSQPPFCSDKVRLIVTMGDPASIGSEIILKALTDSHITAQVHLSIIGSRAWLHHTYNQIKSRANQPLANPETLDIIDVDFPLNCDFGQGNETTGEASFLYLEQAIALTQAGKFEGIITAPIAKYLWQKAGYDYPGQTEVLATKSGSEQFGMMFVAQSPYTGWMLRTLLATTHIPLASVPTTLNPQLMNQKLNLLIQSLEQDFQLSHPHIAIAGLNPHSGEEGKLGTEEKTWLQDWLQQAQNTYHHARLSGLIPPDTMWVKPAQAWYHDAQIQVPDAFLALYHDQGLIPVKLMAFEQAINTTIGLPFIRTSPDHGTAFDIAGKGLANANSMKSAIKLATFLCQNKRQSQIII